MGRLRRAGLPAFPKATAVRVPSPKPQAPNPGIEFRSTGRTPSGGGRP